ncbi:MAG: hypothetical protein ABW278_16515 [Steroidobacteraceae bacterium]
MTARNQLDAYLDQTRRRLQWILSARGLALLAGVLLLVTVAGALLLWRFAFTDAAALGARLVLLAAALAVAGWATWRWLVIGRGAGAAAFERALPAQSGRIATYLQERSRQGRASVLTDLLAADALAIAEREPLASTIPTRRIWLPSLGAAAAAAVLVVLLFLGGPVGEGARHLWLGRLPPAASIAAAAGGIAVEPGDATVRRNQDLPISAIVSGNASEVQVHVRFDGGGEWETVPMEAGANGGYAFTLFAVRDGARYYVTAGRMKSAEHRIQVVDLPTIEKLRLTYEYPGWTGLPQRLEEDGGDIRAVTGTRVAVEVVTSAPLDTPLLVINGSDAKLAVTGNSSRGSLAVREAGHYRIATRFGDEIVPLSPDYVIELVTDEKPNVEIVRPGKDYRATAIEEVPVRVQATDDFRLESLELHYSVNGGEWRAEKLPAGSADIQAAALLRLEELQRAGAGGAAPLLAPGDLVSYYAQARDHSSSVQTDLFLIQVQPFEQRYTQSQAGGGGGGGGGGEEDEDGDISRRQREVLLATWNLRRNQETGSDRDGERAADNARMLAEVQTTLAGQARTLVERAKARALTGQDANVNQFVKSLEEAAKVMEPAAKNLTDMQLPDAIQLEQQALQHLLRAEASFREIQVAMQNSGGGGGGGSQAGRDVSEMTELELDLEKNQYETEPQMTAQQRSQAEDESLRRLRELARRQEQLAREAARQGATPEAQRWQQEQLRREAEELRRQLEQLAQQQSQQRGSQQGGSPQSGSQQSGSQQSGSQQGRGQPGGQPPSQDNAAAEAARQVAQALDQMRQGASRENQTRASEQLNRAREQLERSQQQAERERFSNLAESARELAERQRRAENELRAAIGSRPPPGIANPNRPREPGISYADMERMATTRRELQSDLESLQRRMDSTRRQAEKEAPRASGQVAEARKELEELDTSGSLSRSARDIERGRGVQAATRESVVTDTLQRLQQSLEQAADTAESESGRRQQGREADAGDLLAELGDLRRALDRARSQQQARNQGDSQSESQSGQGQAGASSPNAREGQQGQAGGQQGEGGQGQSQGSPGQSGQGGQGQASAGGNTPGPQGGAGGGANGGSGNFGIAGAGGDGFRGGNGRFEGGGLRQGVPLVGADREALRAQTQLSAERLAQLRQQLANGVLAETDAAALAELTQRLRRGGGTAAGDPMNVEYQRTAALVNQLELAALKAQQAKDSSRLTRAGETGDDSRRYRDNVAEYYRRLGGGND